VYVGSGQGFGFFTTTGGAKLAPSLRVFREPAGLDDGAPPAVRQQMQMFSAVGMPAEPERSRLMLVAGSTRIYGVPLSDGVVCAFVLPAPGVDCVPELMHGAAPVVDSRQDVWGLLGNAAVRVDVLVAGRSLHATVGRNAFYLRLPRGVVAPTSVIVRDRDGARHIYTIRRCRSDTTDLKGTALDSIASPLAPPLAPGC
jgi:hypothetical protein